MTKKGLLEKIEALGKISIEQKRSVVCSLVGHSRAVDMCFGYVTCARCGDQIGDTLASSYDMTDKVVVGHQTKEGKVCSTCKKSYKKLDWRDTVLMPDAKLQELLTGLGLNPAAKKVVANRRKK